MEQRSIVEFFNEHEKYRCGYCGRPDTNYSHGMWAHGMTVQDYQALIDRGWRRSGKYCYKPTMNMTCCPQYTIKCDVVNFKLNKSHKKVIKRVNRYLIHGIKPGEGSARERDDNPGDSDAVMESLPPRATMEPSQINMSNISDVKLPAKTVSSDSTAAAAQGSGDSGVVQTTRLELSKTSLVSDVPSSSGEQIDQAKAESGRPTSTQSTLSTASRSTPRPGSGPDPNRPQCQKAKQKRLERKLSKMSEKGISPPSTPTPSANREKTLEELITEPNKAESCAHRLELKLVASAPRSADFNSCFKAAHKVYHKYQTTIHNDKPDKPNEKQYTRFLVDSPLEPMQKAGEFPEGYGSFHLHYLLDGKIIAVGVIDILPNSVSSVYLYYDPEYRFLSLGTYSALREIMLVRELQQKAQDLRFYYMGFYIHSCPKMRYKGQYHPSFLACPETYRWIPMEQCRPKLDATSYARLDDCAEHKDDEADVDMDSVTVLFQRQLMTYEIYKVFNPGAQDAEEVLRYSQLVGKSCAQRMLLFRK